MDAQGFWTALAPAVTNAEARQRFLADPRGILTSAGLDLPEWFTVSAREGDAPELAITLPRLFDPDAELSEENLAMVTGGGGGCRVHGSGCGDWGCPGAGGS